MLGKVVLITGASSGIGAGVAAHFASRGCLMALTGRSQKGLEDTLRTCLDVGLKEDQVLLVPADLTEAESPATVVDKTINKFGRLDVLVNNAGAGKVAAFSTVTHEDYDKIMNTNVKATFFLTQYALPHLISSRGNVVIVSSAGSQLKVPNMMPYCMGKAALDHFTRCLALDLARKNVRVNTVNPTMIGTPLWERMGFTGDLKETAKTFSAMGRPGTVEEVARAIAFLADNSQSSFTTGATLFVDGGAALVGANNF